MVHAVCVFVAGIHLSRTQMSGSFESVQWNVHVHRLDLSLYSHPKEFWGNGVRTHVNSKGKNPLYQKILLRGEPTTLHPVGQRAQHTTNWAIRVPCLLFNLFCWTCKFPARFVKYFMIGHWNSQCWMQANTPYHKWDCTITCILTLSNCDSAIDCDETAKKDNSRTK